MLRLQVHHRTTYSYSEPVVFGRHRLVLRPREGHDLRIVEMALAIEPEHELTWVRDVYGNSLALVDFTAPAARLEIVSDVTIERMEPFPARRFHEPWLVPWPVEYAVEEQVVVDAYRRLSFPDDASALEQWLGIEPVRRAGDAEGTLLDLCSRVHGAIAYRRRAERGVQTPRETLREANGSCRDMATLMMDAARVLGVASRFASGYAHSAATLAGRRLDARMDGVLPAGPRLARLRSDDGQSRQRPTHRDRREPAPARRDARERLVRRREELVPFARRGRANARA